MVEKEKKTKTKTKVKPKTKTKKNDTQTVRTKRKRAVARAHVSNGSGIIRVNKMLLSAIDNPYTRSIMSEPLNYVPEKLWSNVDIKVTVYGGGQMGQAQAVRGAIARALVKHANDNALEEDLLNIDKFLLIEDSRRVEPKKYMGPKARARKQKSYR
jgi:small subunit ribosomal protein S9